MMLKREKIRGVIYISQLALCTALAAANSP